MVVGMRGRKPGAPELRLVKGERRVRGLAVADPARRVDGDPAIPDDFDAEHVTKFGEVVNILREQGTLGRECGDVIRFYVVAFVEARRARAHVFEHGAVVSAPRTGVPMLSPFLSVARAAETTCAKLAAEMGLTPSSRSRVSRVSRPADTNPFAALG